MYNYLAISIAFLSCLFGGISTHLSLCIFLLVNSLCIIFIRAKLPLNKTLLATASLLIFISIFSSMQVVYCDDFKINLSNSGLSFESVAMLFSALAWMIWLTTIPFEEKKRRWLFRSYGWFVAAVGILSLIARNQHWPFPFTTPNAYGIFPNTNHMSNWLAMAGILLCGTLLADFRKKKWMEAGISILALGGILTCLAANSSRGGLSVFFIGTTLWAIGQSIVGPERRVGLGLLGATILATTALLFVGAKPLERMKASIEQTKKNQSPGDSGTKETIGDTVDWNFRLILQRDALDLLLAHPWLGVGPGNFESLFPRYRTRTAATQSIALHPESDWLWFACEYGLPATLILLFGIFLFLRQAGPGKNPEGWVTRSAGLSTLIAFALHGLVDVPGHRFGTVWPMLIVAGMIVSRKPSSSVDEPTPTWERFLIRGLGVGVFLIGLSWTIGLMSRSNWPVTAAIERAKTGVAEAWKADNVDLGLSESERGLSAAPADQALRFLHGKALLFFNDTEAEAQREFAIQNWLEPYLLSIPLDQATAWTELRPNNPNYAVEAYREALLRAEHCLDRDHGPEQVLEHMSRMSTVSPALESQILPLIENQPRLLSLYINNLNPDIFRPTLAALLVRNPGLNGWNETSLRSLFVSWSRKGEPGTLEPTLESHPEWWPSGWLILAQLRAKSGKTREALELTEKFISSPTLPDEPCPPAQAEARWYRSPRDYGAAYVLAETRRKNGDLTGARVVLEKVTERPDAPSYFWWLRSRIESEEKRDTAAWESLKKYLQKTAPGWTNL